MRKSERGATIMTKMMMKATVKIILIPKKFLIDDTIAFIMSNAFVAAVRIAETSRAVSMMSSSFQFSCSKSPSFTKFNFPVMLTFVVPPGQTASQVIAMCSSSKLNVTLLMSLTFMQQTICVCWLQSGPSEENPDVFLNPNGSIVFEDYLNIGDVADEVPVCCSNQS
ncbi:hypothetical protein Y032_0056g2674 [Ancylostoma ceylanicum]|uniref:Ig-like domain-containing protein n=1 Tax=Ancylostoma ceylanicum TaxID=53326 RepID=A0A016U4S6_9BILA|nr:hypothetical protein Y032_0056g2674 [Ancylostoma ceylanicum]